MIINKSYEYEQFKFIDFNRSIDKKNLIELMDLNKTRNRFHLFPIVIDKKFNIIDGQHRFEACKRMGNPVYYVIDDTKQEHWDAITEVNRAGKKHNIHDVFEMLLKRNDVYCNMINSVRVSYPTLNIGELCRYFINQTGTDSVLRLMQVKQHKVVDFDYKFKVLKEFISTFGYFKYAHAHSTLKVLSKVPEYTVKKYLQILRGKGFVPVNSWSTATFRDELIRVYNKRRKFNRITW